MIGSVDSAAGRVRDRRLGGIAAAALASAAVACPGPASSQAAGDAAPDAYEIVGDGIPAPIGGKVGDAARGRRIVADRTAGLCLMCHSGPLPEVGQQGDLAPDLAGAGTRWTTAQLRLRVADARSLDPATIMPPMLPTAHAVRVAPRFAGKGILDAQQVEDVVAFLETLK